MNGIDAKWYTRRRGRSLEESDPRAPRGGVGFGEEFARFAAALPKWREPSGAFADGALFPDVERVGTLAVGHPPEKVDLPYTAFALYDVPVPGRGTLTLHAELADGDSGGPALVTRSRHPGALPEVTTAFTALPHGGPADVSVPSGPDVERVTVVFVNSQVTTKPRTNVSSMTVRLGFVAAPSEAAVVSPMTTRPGPSQPKAKPPVDPLPRRALRLLSLATLERLSLRRNTPLVLRARFSQRVDG